MIYLQRYSAAEIVRSKHITRQAVNQIKRQLSNNKPLLRFVRFMSLMPVGGATFDDADFSTMTATMENLKINGSTWRVSNDHIEYAWSVQEASINDLKISTLTSGGIAGQDHISMIHRYQLH